MKTVQIKYVPFIWCLNGLNRPKQFYSLIKPVAITIENNFEFDKRQKRHENMGLLESSQTIGNAA